MAKPKNRPEEYPYKIKDRTNKLDKRKDRMPMDGKGFGQIIKNAYLKRLKKLKKKNRFVNTRRK